MSAAQNRRLQIIAQKQPIAKSPSSILTPICARDAVGSMKKLAALSFVFILACVAPAEQPADVIETPRAESMAACSPYQACDLQNPPCSCPAGFVCGFGACVRSVNPYIGCNNTADCIITSPPYANTCWKPICYNPGQPGGDCGWEPEPTGTPCKRPNGTNGQCGGPLPNGEDHTAECI